MLGLENHFMKESELKELGRRFLHENERLQSSDANIAFFLSFFLSYIVLLISTFSRMLQFLEGFVFTNCLQQCDSSS